MKKKKRKKQPERLPMATFGIAEEVDRRAFFLARKILKGDFKKLQDNFYLRFDIKIRSLYSRRTRTKTLYLFKNAQVFEKNKKTGWFFKYCSVISAGPPFYPDIRYSAWDKLIAYYLWLKYYEKHPITIKRFKEQFNPIVHAEKGWEELFQEMIRLDADNQVFST